MSSKSDEQTAPINQTGNIRVNARVRAPLRRGSTTQYENTQASFAWEVETWGRKKWEAIQWRLQTHSARGAARNSSVAFLLVSQVRMRLSKCTRQLKQRSHILHWLSIRRLGKMERLNFPFGTLYSWTTTATVTWNSATLVLERRNNGFVHKLGATWSNQYQCKVCDYSIQVIWTHSKKFHWLVVQDWHTQPNINHQSPVPRQKDAHTCGLHCCMMQVFMRKALADGPIAFHIETDNYRQFSETYFSYSTDDVLGLRQDLQTLALALHPKQIARSLKNARATNGRF